MNENTRYQATTRAPAGSRPAEMERLIASVEGDGDSSPGAYRALAMFIADAALAADDETLSTGQRLLKRVYFHRLRSESRTEDALEERGRLLALIDVANRLLRRITPAAELASIEPTGHSRRFLEAIGATPGLSNQKLMAILETDLTEVSRVGRRLVDGGLARKRKLGRWNHWELTPRGAHVLRLQPSAPPPPDYDRIRDLAREMIETADVREPDDPPGKWMPIAGRVFATLLASEKPLSPIELAEKTGLSRRVVAAAAGFLVDDGYVTQDGRERQPGEVYLPELSLPLTVNATKYCAIGVNILPDRLVGVIVDLAGLREAGRENGNGATAGRVVTRELADGEPETAIAGVIDLVAELREEVEGSDLPKYTIGVGIETGGHVDSHRGEIVFSPNLNWKGIRLADRIRAATGLPTVVENDVNALALHEQLVGTGIGLDYFACILLDQGIGCGLILDGQLMRGTTGMAGELGHVVIDPDGPPCSCTKAGCLESIASVRGILNAIGKERGELPQTIDQAAELAADGDEAAMKAFRDAGAAMGRAIAILQNLVNVERILLSVPRVLDLKTRTPAAKLFNGELYVAQKSHVFSTAADDCTLDIRHLPAGEEYGAHGAAATVVRQFVYRPLAWKPTLTLLGPDELPPEGEPELTTANGNGQNGSSEAVADLIDMAVPEALSEPLALI